MEKFVLGDSGKVVTFYFVYLYSLVKKTKLSVEIWLTEILDNWLTKRPILLKSLVSEKLVDVPTSRAQLNEWLMIDWLSDSLTNQPFFGFRVEALPNSG